MKINPDFVLRELLGEYILIPNGDAALKYGTAMMSVNEVIIINADKVKLTGNKWTDRVYLKFSGYPGGQKQFSPADLMARPNGADKLLRHVVKGMLPKNRLGAKLLSNMYVYAGSEHKHEAQSPKSIDINLLK